MPLYLLSNEQKITDTEYARLEGTLKWWFDVLDMNPVLLLGEHRSTRGLTILPFQRNNLDPGNVLKVLESAIEYLKNSAAER